MRQSGSRRRRLHQTRFHLAAFMAERYKRPVARSWYEVSKRRALRRTLETGQEVRKARNQLKNAEYTKANSDAREIPIRERRDRKRPDRWPSAGACFRCRIGLARERRPCPGARPRVD